MLFSMEQAFVGREEIRAPLKRPAWEARKVFALVIRTLLIIIIIIIISLSFKIGIKLPLGKSHNSLTSSSC